MPRNAKLALLAIVCWALVSIPVIRTTEDRGRHKRFVRYSWGGGVVGMILIVAAIHLFIRPLDIVWVTVLRRLGV